MVEDASPPMNCSSFRQACMMPFQANFAARFNALVEQNMGRDPIANAPEFERITRELLNYTSLMTEAESIAERLPEGRIFTAAMLDSGNGAYAAASVAHPDARADDRWPCVLAGDRGSRQSALWATRPKPRSRCWSAT